MTHGNQLMIANTAVVGVVRPPRDFRPVIAGDAQAVFRWMRSTLMRWSPIGRQASTRRAQSRR
jgi:hypothetical protein